MIIEFINKDRNRNPFLIAYKTINGKKEYLCTVFDRIEGNEQIMLYDFGNYNEKLYFSILSPKGKRLLENTKPIQRLSTYFVLDDNDNCIGEINYEPYKLQKHIILNYHIIIFKYREKKYDIFEIGFGNKDGQYFCVYKDNQLIAVFQNNYPNEYGKALYTIYSQDNDAIELSFLAAYWFLKREYRYNAEQGSSRYITMYKEIKDKYDPEFINRIKQIDGFND